MLLHLLKTGKKALINILELLSATYYNLDIQKLPTTTTRHFFPLWNMEQFDIKNHLFLLCKVECSCVPEFLA